MPHTYLQLSTMALCNPYPFSEFGFGVNQKHVTNLATIQTQTDFTIGFVSIGCKPIRNKFSRSLVLWPKSKYMLLESFPRRIVATSGLPDYMKGFRVPKIKGCCRYHRPCDLCLLPQGLGTWPFPMLVQWVASIHGWSIAPIRGATVEDGAWARHAGAALHGSFVFHGRPCGGNFQSKANAKRGHTFEDNMTTYNPLISGLCLGFMVLYSNIVEQMLGKLRIIAP